MRKIKWKIISIVLFTILLLSIVGVVTQVIYSKSYYQAKQDEIESIVETNIEKVNKFLGKMEQNAQDLAVGGSLFYGLKQENPKMNFDESIKSYLVETYNRFPDAIGGGIWFDEKVYDSNTKYYGPYAYWDNGSVTFTWDLSSPEYDYLIQDWYIRALPADWNRNQKRDKHFYWTAPYMDQVGTEALMITVDAFIYDKNGKIIGLSTVDLSLENILKYLNNIKATEHSNTFMMDTDSGLIVSYTLDNEMIMKDSKEINWLSNIVTTPNNKIGVLKNQNIDGVKNTIYYSLTDSNMLYGIIVPHSDMMSALLSIKIITSTLFLLITLLSLIIVIFAINKITKPITTLSNMLKNISEGEGDLTSRINLYEKDETGDMSKYFDRFADKIHNLVKQTGDSLKQLINSTDEIYSLYKESSKTSEEVSETIHEMASRAVNQSYEIKSASVIVDKITRNIELANTNTSKLSQSSQKVLASAGEGLKLSNTAVEIIGNLRTSTEYTSNIIRTLGDESQKIGHIVDIIKDIAEQTNLLALNASIEAARAGAQGKGFSVIATEVQKLSVESSLSAQKITALVDNIQSSTHKAVEFITINTGNAYQGVLAVNSTGDYFNTIVSDITQMVSQIKLIAEISSTIVKNSREASLNINNISSISEKSAANSQEISSLAEAQAALIEQSFETVEVFKNLSSDLQLLVSKFKY